MTIENSAARNGPLYYKAIEGDAKLAIIATISVPAYIAIASDEFTCLCPLTGQPDYGSIRVAYSPATNRAIESKSFKIYLMSYRNRGMYHEDVVSQIVADIVETISNDALRWVLVRGLFAPRGGVAFEPCATYGTVPADLLYR